MKRLVALILVCIFCMATAYAAEWAEGLSPAKPSNLKREVDLTQTVGYWLMFPRTGLSADRFCDVLEIYLPNPDVELGEGTATLWDADGEVAIVDFADPAQVELRPLEEVEMESMHWGSGVCVEMHLPISLKFDEAYYVTMDEGTLTSNGGKVKSSRIPYSDQVPIEEQYWTPSVTGDFGISGLYYSEAAEVDEEAEETEAEGPIEPKYNPAKGDAIHFDLVLGGDAKTAVMYSENDSVYFETLEYTESSAVTATITGDELNWGVVFLDENGDVVDYVNLAAAQSEE
ncbi:MAG: hypothetical protein IJ769_08685 [Clostridia bacterium]|nr:hypothetical protein [Clostridia bacterium]